MGKGRAVAWIWVGLLCAGCLDPVTEPDREVLALLEGTVHTVDGGDPSGLLAIWEPAGGGIPDSAAIGPDGAFTLGVTSPSASGALVVDGAADRYHPFFFPFALDTGRLELVLVPNRWTV